MELIDYQAGFSLQFVRDKGDVTAHQFIQCPSESACKRRVDVGHKAIVIIHNNGVGDKFKNFPVDPVELPCFS